MFVGGINFISDTEKVHSSKFCKGADKGGYEREEVDKQKDYKECMKKCLELDPPALLFSVQRPYACNKAKPPKPCKCWCHHKRDPNGGCRAVRNAAFDVYKILYKGILILN